MFQFIREHLVNGNKPRKGEKKATFRKRLENEVAESYGFNLFSGINNDLMF